MFFLTKINFIISQEGETSAILLKVDINIINMETCNLDYFGIIPEKMVCAGDKAGGKDSCQVSYSYIHR